MNTSAPVFMTHINGNEPNYDEEAFSILVQKSVIIDQEAFSEDEEAFVKSWKCSYHLTNLN